MTESQSPHLNQPRITVLPVEPGDPPFRLVEIDGEITGVAFGMTDVVVLATAAGIRIDDLDDPASVRWVGGGKLTWKLH
ncbi:MULTISPECIES: hypothetical protein [Streptomyces]|uniref:Uncharacterized protein n=1 Tax=Streptomyces halstedii TaxID=1944 RepID=A0A6N9TRR0_STRHA|nr:MULTISPECIES: hypothetical protein [Streptomyces]AWL41161.1 hypothetical protein B9S64_25995 [Streptomyces sp. SM18]MBV7671653.1 hypothetical protein [Streptomyces halstedii]NEA14048.1 hypothetical protein [Streptomyces halstedii]